MYLKFIYSDKATNFWEISTVDLSYVLSNSQIYGDFAKFCGVLRIYELYLKDQKHENILTWTVLGVASSCHCTWAITTTSISFSSCFITRSRLDSTATGFWAWGVAAPIGPYTIYWKYIISILNYSNFALNFDSHLSKFSYWSYDH